MKPRLSIPLILAVVLPALLIGLGFRHLARPDSGLLDERAAGIQKRLNKATPTVAIVGNSLARDDIDAKQLTKGIEAAGLSAQVVSKLAVGGTPPPVWYAMLKHHVFGQGHKPDVIIVAGTLESFFWTQVSTVGETQRLRELVGTNDAEILQKATGRDFVVPALERAGTRKVALRDQLLEAWADWTISLVNPKTPDATEGESPDPKVAARTEIDAAFEALFESDGAIDMELHKRVIPVMQDGSGTAHVEEKRPLEDTFLPLFQKMAAEQESRLVFVRVPLSTNRAHHDPDDRVEEMIAWSNANNVGFVDLSDLSVEERHFRDGKHLNKRGRTLFTDALAQSLVTLGTFGDGPLEAAEAPLDAAEITRGGPVPKLASVKARDLTTLEGCVSATNRPDLAPYAQGPLSRKRLWNASPLMVRVDGKLQPLVPGRVVKKDCKGVALNGKQLMVAGLSGNFDVVLHEGTPFSQEGKKPVYWVYPGSPLVVNLGDARREALASSGEAVSIEVVVQPLRQGAAPVTVSLDQGPATVAETRRGRLVEAVLTPVTVPSTIHIASDEPAVARLVRVRSDSRTEVLLGEPSRGGESVVRMFEGGNAKAQFGGPPPTLKSPPAKAKGDELTWKVPELKHINTSAVFRASDKYNCSPVRVLKGGQVEPFAYVNCSSLKPGAICFDGGQVRAQPKTAAAPSGYSLGLDPSRICRTWTFIYGGDTLTFDLPDNKLKTLLTDLEQMELMAEVLPPVGTKLKDEHWTISLHTSEGRLVKRRLKVQDFAASMQRFPLNTGRGQSEIRLTLEADPGAPPLILGYVLLRERALPPVPASPADIKSLKSRIQMLSGQAKAKSGKAAKTPKAEATP